MLDEDQLVQAPAPPAGINTSPRPIVTLTFQVPLVEQEFKVVGLLHSISSERFMSVFTVECLTVLALKMAEMVRSKETIELSGCVFSGQKLEEDMEFPVSGMTLSLVKIMEVSGTKALAAITCMETLSTKD